MRSLLTLLAASTLAVPLARAEEDPRYFYSLSFQSGMTMTRYAKPDYAESVRPTRPDGVSVIWSYRSDDEALDPIAEQEINAINDVVAEALKTQPTAVLALTSIRRGRQGIWAFYTSDGAGLTSALEVGLKGKTRTPVRLRAVKDPEWKAFSNFLARISEEK